ncbi:phosphatase PAP2 family protein [Nocardioides islandensis]|uniref:phosphatase PAP2 family protein n=1 Tax=Nocardioides islandensis TaxID=433663 RepID=UPI001E541616|nr:phosphatase PAP2 family protein [Nocardioides islandensis]
MSLTSTADQRRTTQPRKRGWAATAGLVVLAWVLICAVLVGWGWLLTHSLEKSIDPTDNDIARWFADERTSGLEPYADAGTFLGETIVGASAFTVVGILVSLVRRTWIPILLVAILEAGLGAYYFVATHLITRDRPPVKILDAGLDPNASFPSGHTATALVFCVGTLVLIWTYFRSARWWFVWLLLLPVATVLARLYQGAHHLTDVLTSVVYASVWLAVVAALVLPRRDRV